MAYNPALYYPAGTYGNSYGQMQVQQGQPVQSFAPPVKGAIEWVDGEVGAKAFQIPMGMTMPVALWDSNEPVIYLRSVNSMGMPNPMKRIRYVIEDEPQKASGDQARLTSGENRPDMSEYVRRDELQSMKDELLRSIRENGRGESGGRRSSRGDDE